jgi:hypothetical protein
MTLIFGRISQSRLAAREVETSHAG